MSNARRAASVTTTQSEHTFRPCWQRSVAAMKEPIPSAQFTLPALAQMHLTHRIALPGGHWLECARVVANPDRPVIGQLLDHPACEGPTISRGAREALPGAALFRDYADAYVDNGEAPAAQLTYCKISHGAPRR